LVRVKRSDGDTLESAQGIESRDVVNFQRIAQVMAQEKDLALNQKTYPMYSSASGGLTALDT
jgi:hypothetical protein